jgi:hypothetical protein
VVLGKSQRFISSLPISLNGSQLLKIFFVASTRLVNDKKIPACRQTDNVGNQQILIE